MRCVRRPIVLLVSVLLAAAASCAPGAGPIACSEFRFDAARWRAEPQERQRQGRALARCGTLEGKTRAQVRRMIGRPDPELSSARHWTYDLGPERGVVALDDVWLDLEFREDRVLRAAASQRG